MNKQRLHPVTSQIILVLCSVLLVITFPLCSLAAEDPTQPEQTAEEPIEKGQTPESVEKNIEIRDELAYDPTRRSLFPETYVLLRNKLYELERKLGLEITFSYDFLTQGYADNDQSLRGTSGDATLSGRWLLFGSRYNLPVFLTFRARHRKAYSDYPPSDIASQTGLFWKTVDGFNDSGFQVPEFYISQNLRKDTIILRYGQVTVDTFFDAHGLRGAKRYFLNQVFSNNPTINFPSFGAGFIASWKYNERWDFVGGGSNIQGTEQGTEVDFKLNSSALFSTLQTGYHFNGIRGKSAHIQLMGWHSDSSAEDNMPADSGFSVTLEHQGARDGEDYVFRFAHADGEATGTDIAVFAGFGKTIRGFDNLGLGVGAGRSYQSGEWQGVFESYYRWQVTKELLITPDLQLIVGEGLDGDSGLRFVAGLRMGIIF